MKMATGWLGQSCPCCAKPFTKKTVTRHHLVPKTEWPAVLLSEKYSAGYCRSAIVYLCAECHRMAHQVATTKEMVRLYSDIEQFGELLSMVRTHLVRTGKLHSVIKKDDRPFPTYRNHELWTRMPDATYVLAVRLAHHLRRTLI